MELNQSYYFIEPITWLVSASVIYLMILGLMVFFAEYYFATSEARKNSFVFKRQITINSKFKLAAILPVMLIIGSIFYLDSTQSVQQNRNITQRFALNENTLELNFTQQKLIDSFAKKVVYKFKTNNELEGVVKLDIVYSSYGENPEAASTNLKAIDYLYVFENNTLKLDEYWTLKPKAFNRAQSVTVTISVPTNAQITSNFPLIADSNFVAYQYSVKSKNNSKNLNKYLAVSAYLHEISPAYLENISQNEKLILAIKFCSQFFIGESWRCSDNLSMPVSRNSRFNKAYMEKISSVEKIRQFLTLEHSLTLEDLEQIQSIVQQLTLDQPGSRELDRYLKHLLGVKAKIKTYSG